jgi:RNase P/RNase MRP subunit POP5
MQMKLKVENSTIKATAAALGRIRQEDPLEVALNAVRKSETMKRFTQMYKSGELYAFDNN